MKMKIKLNSAEEVARFVALAEKCESDVNVQYRHFLIDGKSLVGMMSLDLSNELIIYYNDENPVFESLLKNHVVKKV